MPTGTSSSEPVRRPRPGRPATPADLSRAQQRDRILRTELDRVRSAALAWRNGLGVLLVGLIGFGLVKGRADVGELAPVWAAAVGLLLLVALLTGATGALMLLRAAHGRPTVVAVEELEPGIVLEHREAIAAARLLRKGTAATIVFVGLVVASVALTWYGPARKPPALQVDQSDGSSLCGSVVRAGHGILTLKTASGERTVHLADTVGLRPVTSCGP